MLPFTNLDDNCAQDYFSDGLTEEMITQIGRLCLRWRRHRQTMSKVVANPKVWLIDCLLLVLGGGFAALGLPVY